MQVTLDSYGMQAVNEGIDALATTRVSILPKSDSSISATALHSQSGEKQVPCMRPLPTRRHRSGPSRPHTYVVR